jgi:hypothetical protein
MSQHPFHSLSLSHYYLCNHFSLITHKTLNFTTSRYICTKRTLYRLWLRFTPIDRLYILCDKCVECTYMSYCYIWKIIRRNTCSLFTSEFWNFPPTLPLIYSRFFCILIFYYYFFSTSGEDINFWQSLCCSFQICYIPLSFA